MNIFADLAFQNRYDHSILGCKWCFVCKSKDSKFDFLVEKTQKKEEKDSKIKKKK